MKYLLPGRWQPLHDGHRAMIDKLLAEGHEVIVGIRATPLGPYNPYSAYERWQMIHTIYGDKVKIAVIPDFDIIAYGRKVGWGLREMHLEAEIEVVSGTEIRNAGGRVIWLTGNSGAGKTTLADNLLKRMRAVKLDGNEMRDSISIGAGFSEDERLKHNLRVARLAKKLSKQMDVIVSLIAPTVGIRTRIERIIKPIWVYVKRTLPVREGYFYMIPQSPDIIVDNDALIPRQATDLVMGELTRHSISLREKGHAERMA